MGLERKLRNLWGSFLIGGLVSLCLFPSLKARGDSNPPENVFILEEEIPDKRFEIKSDEEIHLDVWDGDNIYIAVLDKNTNHFIKNMSLYNLKDRTEGDGWSSPFNLPAGDYSITFSQLENSEPGQTPVFPDTMIINEHEMDVNEFGFEVNGEISGGNNSVSFTSTSSNPHFWILKEGGYTKISPVSYDYHNYPRRDRQFTITDTYNDITTSDFPKISDEGFEDGYETGRLREGVYFIKINNINGYEDIGTNIIRPEDPRNPLHTKIYLTKPSLPLAQDVNQDGEVNLLDLISVRDKLNHDVDSGDNWRADVNDDQRINLLDLVSVRNKHGLDSP